MEAPKIFFYYYWQTLTYIKMSIDSSAKIYKNNKKRLQRKSREKYWSLYEEKKKEKQQYGSEEYKNLFEDEKQRLVGYGKNNIKCWKIKKASQIKTDWCLINSKIKELYSENI